MRDAATDTRYWFPAKRYGWGWGLPLRWQGWLSLIVYVALLVVHAIAFAPRTHPAAFLLGVALLSAGIVLVCLLKGEPPAWRWGRS